MSKRVVEARAIECANHYARANGHAGDRDVVGLLLVGMSIGARLPETARRDLATGYDEQFPEEAHVMNAWAERIGERLA